METETDEERDVELKEAGAAEEETESIEVEPFLFQLHLPSHLVLFQLHLPSHLVLFQLHLLSQLFLFQLSLLVHPLALLSLLLLVPVHCGRKN
ncbi:unnamed protein product [Boreogadus saida]